jgi:HSP20 family molecular chaperone IbpA
MSLVRKQVDASYENGVLKVVVAKSAPNESKVHEVAVH